MKYRNRLLAILPLLMAPTVKAADVAEGNVAYTVSFDAGIKCSMEPVSVAFKISKPSWNTLVVNKDVKIICDNMPANTTINLITKDKNNVQDEINNRGDGVLLTDYVNATGIARAYQFPIGDYDLNIGGSKFKTLFFAAPNNGKLTGGSWATVGTYKFTETAAHKEVVIPVKFVLGSFGKTRSEEMFVKALESGSSAPVANFTSKLTLSMS